MQPFIRREAVVCKRIEGTRASLSDLYTYEAKQLTILETDSDADEVHNYVKALDYGLERLLTIAVSLRLIRELNARLMENVRGEHQTPGEFRHSQNCIFLTRCTLQNAPYVPPPVQEMLAALNQLENFMHAANEIPAPPWYVPH